MIFSWSQPRNLLAAQLSYLHDNGPLAGAVQLDQHQTLPGSKTQLPPTNRHGLTGPQECRFDMRSSIAVDSVMPPFPLGNQSREGIQDIFAHVRVRVPLMATAAVACGT